MPHTTFPTSYHELALLLMNRDNITYEDARSIIRDTEDAIREALDMGDFYAIDDIILDDLGLEPDYVTVFINELT